jgi:hypothetical protein
VSREQFFHTLAQHSVGRRPLLADYQNFSRLPTLFWCPRFLGTSNFLVSALFWCPQFSDACPFHTYPLAFRRSPMPKALPKSPDSAILGFVVKHRLNHYTIYQKARSRRGNTFIVRKWGAEARIPLDAFLLRAADRCT